MAAGLCAFTVAVLAGRRIDQFLNPYIWVDDGTLNLTAFLERGWLMVFEPIAGYLSIPMRALFALAASMSLRWLPELLMVFTVIATTIVVLAVACSPTVLRWRAACAVAVLLLPIGVEPYGVSLYLLWWFTLLAILPVLWRPDSGLWRRSRFAMILIGGLSSPVIVALMPIYLARAVWLRSRDEIAAGALAGLAAIVQLWSVLTLAAPSQPANLVRSLPLIVDRFVGMFPYLATTAPMPDDYTGVAYALLALLAWGSALMARRGRAVGASALLLAACFVATTASAAVRHDPAIMHPISAGPRYFFLPYSILAWWLVQIAAATRTPVRIIALALLLSSFLTAMHLGRGRHEYQDWRAYMEACRRSERVQVPIHYEGYAAHGIVWSVLLDGDDCRRHLGAPHLDFEP